MRSVRSFIAIRAIISLTVISAAALSHRVLYSITSRWDAQWYARIAEHGYGTTIVASHGRHLSDYAFFPLLPLAERFLHNITSLSFTTSGVVVSVVASIAAAIAIKNIATFFGSQEFAHSLLILWAIYPFSALLWMSYSEALFTALAAWALYSVMKERWWSAGIFALLAGATRPIGIAVTAAVLIEALLHIKRYRSVKPLPAVLLAPLGWLGFIVYVDIHSKAHSLGAYFDYQRGWGNGFDGGQAFFSWLFRALLHQPVIGFGSAIGVAIVMWALIATCRMKLPRALKIYALIIVAIALSTAGYFSSKPRYLIPAFILLAPVAKMISRWSNRNQIIAYSTLTAVSAVASTLFLLGSTAP